MFLITTKRVIDVDQIGLFKRHIVALAYEDIENVHAGKMGLVGRMCNTGWVRVESKNSHEFDLEMTAIHKPERVRDLILDVQCMQVKKKHHVKRKK